MAKDKGHLVVVNDPADDIAIRVEHVGKSFRLPHNRQNSIKGSLVNLVSRGDRTYETQEVLKDVSFEIKKGEFFGIVGRNGSGKSTLLKMLAGIYTPTKGKIIINGSLTPFIELGVGFNPELTGRENVYLNGALLGFNDKEVDEMYDDIVAFAELEKFMDQRLKNYSSGMQVRLAFSIAIRARSDILLLDEVLAVGDEAFQNKCFEYFETLRRDKRTVVLVTHDMGSVKRFCTKAMFIQDGTIIELGAPKKIAQLYSEANEKKTGQDDVRLKDNPSLAIRIKNENGTHVQSVFSQGESLRVSLGWEDSAITQVGVSIYKGDGTYMFGTSTKVQGKALNYIARLDLSSGNYFLTVYCFDNLGKKVVSEEEGVKFRIKGDTDWGGLVKLQHKWVNNDV